MFACVHRYTDLFNAGKNRYYLTLHTQFADLVKIVPDRCTGAHRLTACGWVVCSTGQLVCSTVQLVSWWSCGRFLDPCSAYYPSEADSGKKLGGTGSICSDLWVEFDDEYRGTIEWGLRGCLGLGKLRPGITAEKLGILRDDPDYLVR